MKNKLYQFYAPAEVFDNKLTDIRVRKGLLGLSEVMRFCIIETHEKLFHVPEYVAIKKKAMSVSPEEKARLKIQAEDVFKAEKARLRQESLKNIF